MKGDNETQGDPKRPKENLLSPETTRPKKTQRESLESRDYETVSEPPPTEGGSFRDNRVVSGLKRFSLGLLGSRSLRTQEILVGSRWVSLGLFGSRSLLGFLRVLLSPLIVPRLRVSLQSLDPC